MKTPKWKTALSILKQKGFITGREIIMQCSSNYPMDIIRDLKRNGINLDKEKSDSNYYIYRLAE